MRCAVYPVCTHRGPDASDMKRKVCSHYTDEELDYEPYVADEDLRWIEEDENGTSKT